MTAPLTAIREEQEPWFRGIPQKAKDWMAEKLVDKLIVQQLDPESSGSEDEDEEEELEDVVVDGQKEASPEKLPSQKGLILFIYININILFQIPCLEFLRRRRNGYSEDAETFL